MPAASQLTGRGPIDVDVAPIPMMMMMMMRIWHFMQIVSLGDNLHEVLDPII